MKSASLFLDIHCNLSLKVYVFSQYISYSVACTCVSWCRLAYICIPIQCQISFLKLYFLKDIHSNVTKILSFPAEKHKHFFLRNGRLLSLYLFLAKSIYNLDAHIVRHSDYDLNSRGKYKCQFVHRKDMLWWESTNKKGY